MTYDVCFILSSWGLGGECSSHRSVPKVKGCSYGFWDPFDVF
jgi:hypothetical protein